LDPLKRTAEAALIIRADLSRIHASSFHQSSSSAGPGDSAVNNNAILQANSDSLLKTETGIGCEDLRDFFFRQDRDEQQQQDDGGETMPPNVNQRVVLVFLIKEAKAFLQFANSNVNSQHDDGDDDESNNVDLFFHLGGKPIVWQIQEQQEQTTTTSNSLGDTHISCWKAELI
jgi:hypothetical protein